MCYLPPKKVAIYPLEGDGCKAFVSFIGGYVGQRLALKLMTGKVRKCHAKT